MFAAGSCSLSQAALTSAKAGDTLTAVVCVCTALTAMNEKGFEVAGWLGSKSPFIFQHQSCLPGHPSSATENPLLLLIASVKKMTDNQSAICLLLSMHSGSSLVGPAEIPTCVKAF